MNTDWELSFREQHVALVTKFILSLIHAYKFLKYVTERAVRMLIQVIFQHILNVLHDPVCLIVQFNRKNVAHVFSKRECILGCILQRLRRVGRLCSPYWAQSSTSDHLQSISLLNRTPEDCEQAHLIPTRSQANTLANESG